MALIRAALLAASLGCSAVLALPENASSSGPDTFSVFKAHTESKQPALLVPTTTSSKHTPIFHAPSLETPESHLSVAPSAPSPDVRVPHTESREHSLDVPKSTHPDLRRSTSDVDGTPATVDQHQVPGSDGTPYTPSGETTLYAAGTPVVTGPAGTAIIIHGTPIMGGLPAAIVDGTTYALEAGASTLWINGRPEPVASPTPWAPRPDSAPHYTEPTHVSWHTTHRTEWSAVTHAHPKPTHEAAKPTHSSLEKPSEKPSKPAASSITWTGPGLTTETGIGNAAGTLIPGLTLAMICFLVTLM